MPRGRRDVSHELVYSHIGLFESSMTLSRTVEHEKSMRSLSVNYWSLRYLKFSLPMGSCTRSEEQKGFLSKMRMRRRKKKKCQVPEGPMTANNSPGLTTPETSRRRARFSLNTWSPRKTSCTGRESSGQTNCRAVLSTLKRKKKEKH